MRLLPVLLAAICGLCQSAAAASLPAIGVDLSRVTVSGLSSGAYMAGQFQLAYSGMVSGAGLVAGGPYACAHTPTSELNPFWSVVIPWNLNRAQTKCMEDGWLFSSVPDADSLLDYAQKLAGQDRIASLDGLQGDRVYLFSSSADDTVESGVVEAAADFYRLAGVADDNLRLDQHDRAAHAFLTEDAGLSCGATGSPFLNDCDFDQAKAILEWLLGSLQSEAAAVESGFIRFPQDRYAQGSEASLGEDGIVYVPKACRTRPGCAVHVVFHGCKQGLERLGDAFVKGSGYARWAEGNRLVLLFPQVAESTLNPNGCWDWWGYTGRDFLTRQAPQISAVKQMLDRLSANP